MDPNFGIRPSGHLYQLRSDPEYLFWTRHLPDGRQVLASGLSAIVVYFDRLGKLLEVEECKALLLSPEDRLEREGLEDRPIVVQRFHVPGYRTRIEDLPGHLEDFRNTPDDPTYQE